MVQSGISRQMSPRDRSSRSSQSSGRITVATDSGASFTASPGDLALLPNQQGLLTKRSVGLFPSATRGKDTGFCDITKTITVPDAQ